MKLENFRETWAVDTEFRTPPGDLVEPVCLVAQELESGREIRWKPGDPEPAELTNPNNLVAVFAAGAEMSFFHALDWPMPPNLIDLLPEVKALERDGRMYADVEVGGVSVKPWSLLGVCHRLGIPVESAQVKEETRALRR